MGAGSVQSYMYMYCGVCDSNVRNGLCCRRRSTRELDGRSDRERAGITKFLFQLVDVGLDGFSWPKHPTLVRPHPRLKTANSRRTRETIAGDTHFWVQDKNCVDVCG